MKLLNKVESKKIGCRKYTMGLFECSCGNKVIRIKRDGLKAMFCSHFCYAKNRKKRGAYKSRIIINKYLYIYHPNHPYCIGTKKLYVAEHRLLMEIKVGRYLTKNEVVHHINEDTMDNRIENLQLMTASKHNSQHAKLRKRKENGKF